MGSVQCVGFMFQLWRPLRPTQYSIGQLVTAQLNAHIHVSSSRVFTHTHGCYRVFDISQPFFCHSNCQDCGTITGLTTLMCLPTTPGSSRTWSSVMSASSSSLVLSVWPNTRLLSTKVSASPALIHCPVTAGPGAHVHRPSLELQQKHNLSVIQRHNNNNNNNLCVCKRFQRLHCTAVKQQRACPPFVYRCKKHKY